MTITDFLSENRIIFKEAGTHHHATTGRAQVDCPYCSAGSGKYRMGLALSGTHASCWTCGSKPIADALALLTGKHWRDIKKVLGSLPATRHSESRRRGKLELPASLGPLLRQHRDYLAGRGFDPVKLERLWGIKGIGVAAELAWHIFIPIHLNGEVVSWTSRNLIDEGTRYHAARPDQEAVSAKEILYGGDLARHSVIVVEGHLDAMAIGPGAVGTGGVVYSTAQVQAIKRFPKRAILFDNEPAAQRRARRLCADLSTAEGATVNVVLDYKDPAEALKKNPNEIKQLRKELLS